jgi:2-keto-4-pentenoate hydratase/2-oxohepta-3-ene-1,7-dioic acid hydratase in catechol pathway
MIARHTSNGCNVYPGDPLASGTASGAADGSRHSLGAHRRLKDGDEVITRIWSE